jgi:hypothetical protein
MLLLDLDHVLVQSLAVLPECRVVVVSRSLSLNTWLGRRPVIQIPIREHEPRVVTLNDTRTDKATKELEKVEHVGERWALAVGRERLRGYCQPMPVNSEQ